MKYKIWVYICYTIKQKNMKNAQNITEAKIATCEKFLKEMSRLYQMESGDTKAQDQAMYIMSKVEQMIAQLEK